MDRNLALLEMEDTSLANLKFHKTSQLVLGTAKK
jgi:hypothetical protein